VLDGLDEMDYFDQVRRWAGESQTGDRAELASLPENLSFWRHIDARSDICIGSKCPSSIRVSSLAHVRRRLKLTS